QYAVGGDEGNLANSVPHGRNSLIHVTRSERPRKAKQLAISSRMDRQLPSYHPRPGCNSKLNPCRAAAASLVRSVVGFAPNSPSALTRVRGHPLRQEALDWLV